MTISNSNPLMAEEDGYKRGLRQEHLTNPSVTDRTSTGISQLATVLGYIVEAPYDPSGRRLRASFIVGYARATKELREARAQQEPDPEIRAFRAKTINCLGCGCDLTPGMSYRGNFCHDCCEAGLDENAE